MHNREIYLARLLDQIDVISIGLSQKKGDIRPLLLTVLLVRWRAFRTAFRKVSSHQKVHPELFADSSNIPWNPPSIRHPDRTATAPQMSPLSPCELLKELSHLFLIFVVLTYKDSRIIRRKTCQKPRNCQCRCLSVSLSAPGTSSGSSGSLEKILFCTSRTVTTGLPSLVPPRHIGDCSAIHILHWELCDPQ